MKIGNIEFRKPWTRYVDVEIEAELYVAIRKSVMEDVLAEMQEAFQKVHEADLAVTKPDHLWHEYTCSDCNETINISKRALTGKYMIADHKKVCKGKEAVTEKKSRASALPEVKAGGNTGVYNGYCITCKEKRDFKGAVITSDSGRQMARGKCPVCGTKMNRILGKVQK